MNRSWISVVAAIALLAQSLSMAWASTQAAMPDHQAEAGHVMPCHGDASDTGKTRSCCNGDCIFMCGGAPLPAPLAAPSAPTADNHFPAAPVPALLASHTLSPFRPPAR